MESAEPRDLPDRLMRAMHARGYGDNRSELARALSKNGRTVQAARVSEWLSGQEPGAYTIALLASTLDVSADYLVGLTDEMKRPAPGAKERAFDRMAAIVDQARSEAENGVSPAAEDTETPGHVAEAQKHVHDDVQDDLGYGT